MKSVISLFVLLAANYNPSETWAKDPATSAPKSSPKIVFTKKKLKLLNQTILVEVADSPEKSAQGLMFRRELPEGTGMIFIFEDEARRNFWMKNTFIPLSIGFFDSKQRLVEFFDMEPTKSEMDLNPPSYESKNPAKYALEVPRGWFQKHKIPIGTKFELN